MNRPICQFALLLTLMVLLGCTSSSSNNIPNGESDGSTKPPETVLVVTNSIGMQLIPIPAGEFLMGSPDGVDAEQRERPQHRVRITKPFLLGVHAITQDQYEQVAGHNPSRYPGDGQRPVEQVSWLDAIEFCNSLSEEEGLEPYYQVDGEAVTILAGTGYRLPTEAEWEYACRAGSQTEYSFGDDPKQLREYGWFTENSWRSGKRRYHPVGQKKPNAWGLYDMHGGVWEWCWDKHDSSYYRESPEADPSGPTEGRNRVLRGGSLSNKAWACRSASRYDQNPTLGSGMGQLGFRVARSSTGK